MKTSENHRFSDVFWGYRNVILDQNGLMAKITPDVNNSLSLIGDIGDIEYFNTTIEKDIKILLFVNFPASKCS